MSNPPVYFILIVMCIILFLQMSDAARSQSNAIQVYLARVEFNFTLVNEKITVWSSIDLLFKILYEVC